MVDVNDLNGKFVNINIPSPISNMSDDVCYVPVENPFNFHCVDQMEVFKSFSLVKSNAIRMDGLHSKFLRILMPKLLLIFRYSCFK